MFWTGAVKNSIMTGISHGKLFSGSRESKWDALLEQLVRVAHPLQLEIRMQHLGRLTVVEKEVVVAGNDNFDF